MSVAQHVIVGAAAMGFIQSVFRLLMFVVVVCLNVVQAQSQYWPPALLQDHQYWQPIHQSNLFRPRAPQSDQLVPTEVPLPVTESIDTTSVPDNVDSNPVVQEIEELSLEFPDVQGKPEQKPEQFGLRRPTPTNSLAVKCGEKAVIVEVKLDFFGTGQRVDSSSITLGGCVAEEVDSFAGVLVFQSALEGCNSLTMVTDEALVYVFSIIYKPKISAGRPIVRSRGAAVNIECHYLRKHNVSSNSLKPTWMPYTATAVAEDFLVFSLQLMTDDWTSERASDVYFLGEFMNIEASVLQVSHMALRLFVDTCVAAGSPDENEDPRYTFIENHGCFTDGKISNSSFLPRSRSSRLQFQLEAFQFQEETSPVCFIYIKCFLKATAASSPTDEEHKACSFMSNGWVSTDGTDQVCNCCNESCGYRKRRALATDKGLQWEGKATIGPLFVKEL
ncbi:zona pellucida sperm-binding protein 3-like [Trichomycterus rosablanca]|uniref:zona pellucida sperm-binding protein 3-like n=1 Tax=Trichomycterus rosablanca TaxID=2290929 RepID=UPI002F351501